MAEVPLHVLVSGTGPTVVFVHGTTANADRWDLVRAQLDGTFRTVAYDRRGRGRSGDASSYSFDDELDDLDRVLDEHGPAHLVGHSFGGRLALEVAARRTDLLSLTLYEPPLDTAAGPAGFTEALAAATRAQDWEAVLATFFPVAGITAEEVAFMRMVPAVWGAFVDGARTVEREVTALEQRPLDVELGAKVDVPAQYLLGGLTDSPVFLNGARELAAQMRAEVHLIAGQRHIAMAATPDVLARLITQLAQR